MTTVPLKEAKERLETLLEEKDFAVMLEDGTTVRLEVKQRAEKKRRGAYGSAKGWFTMAEDFDEPLSDFKNYRS